MAWWIESNYKTYWAIETVEGMTIQKLKKELKKSIKENCQKDIKTLSDELQKRY